MLGIKHFLADVNLQGHAHVLGRHQRGKKFFHDLDQGFTSGLLRGFASATTHAQVQVHKRIVSVATSGLTGSTAIGHGVMRRRISQHTGTTSGEHLFARFIFHGQHGVGQLATQCFHLHLLVELRGIENDEMWHGLQPGHGLVALGAAGHRSGDVLAVLWCDVKHRIQLSRARGAEIRSDDVDTAIVRTPAQGA